MSKFIALTTSLLLSFSLNAMQTTDEASQELTVYHKEIDQRRNKYTEFEKHDRILHEQLEALHKYNLCDNNCPICSEERALLAEIGKVIHHQN